MSTNAPQQFVDLINSDTGRNLLLKDVVFGEPAAYSDSEGRNSAVIAKARGGTANWGGNKRFRYWRLVIGGDVEFIAVENYWVDWNTEEKLLQRFAEWLGGDDVFSSDELLISTYQLIGQPQHRYYSFTVGKENLKYEGSVLFRVTEPVREWDNQIFELNGFKTIVGKQGG